MRFADRLLVAPGTRSACRRRRRGSFGNGVGLDHLREDARLERSEVFRWRASARHPRSPARSRSSRSRHRPCGVVLEGRHLAHEITAPGSPARLADSGWPSAARQVAVARRPAPPACCPVPRSGAAADAHRKPSGVMNGSSICAWRVGRACCRHLFQARIVERLGLGVTGYAQSELVVPPSGLRHPSSGNVASTTAE